MPAEKFFADSAAEVGLNPDKVQALMDRAERDVKDGVLPACQVAIARNGKIAAMSTFGVAKQGGVEKTATDQTVFVAMSATKAVTASALDGAGRPIGEHIPAKKTAAGWALPIGSPVTTWYVVSVHR